MEKLKESFRIVLIIWAQGLAALGFLFALVCLSRLGDNPSIQKKIGQGFEMLWNSLKMIFKWALAILSVYFAIMVLIAPFYAFWEIGRTNPISAVVLALAFFWLWIPLYYLWKRVLLSFLSIRPFSRKSYDNTRKPSSRGPFSPSD